jgi:hypothetical protein
MTSVWFNQLIYYRNLTFIDTGIGKSVTLEIRTPRVQFHCQTYNWQNQRPY